MKKALQPGAANCARGERKGTAKCLPVIPGRRVVLFLIGFFALSGLEVSGSLWDDEDFLDRFTATYGVRGEQEPVVTREEQNLLREVAEYMPENPEDAAAAVEKRIDSGSSAALDFTLANLRFQLDEFEQAVEHYRAAVEKFPDFLRAHKNLGLVLARQDQYAEALESLTRALTLGSADGYTYGLIGFAHLQQNRAVSAEAAYLQALLFEPENANWKVGLAQALQEQERQREAAALLSELTSQYPERADYWMYQANTYIAMNEPAKAATNLELVRRMGEIGQEGLLLLGDIYVNEDLPGLALGVYEEALEGDSTVPFSRVARAAERLSQGGNSTEAARLLARVDLDSVEEASSREKGRLRRLQGRIALAEEKPAEARDFLEEALEANALDGQSLLLLADIIAPSDREQAEVLLERAARLPEVAPRALRRHGELLVNAARYEDALPLLREALELRSSESLRRYIERVERLAETVN